ncbi:hypothetical protein D9M72_522150 [compost metagenome]
MASGSAPPAGLNVMAEAATVTVTAPEVAAALLLSPEYSAVMECAPTASAAVLNVAVVPETEPVESVVDPFLKVTLPVGDAPPAKVAVKVTDAPSTGLLFEAETVTVGATCPTVTVTAAETAAALLASPEYSAVMECTPTASAAVLNVAVVPETEPVPSVVDPFLKVTVPVGDAPPAKVAVKVTDAPSTGLLSEADAVIVGTDVW